MKIRATAERTGTALRMLVSALALLSAGGAPASAAEEIRIVETRAIPVAQPGAMPRPSHGLHLSLYVFRGARWSADAIAAAALEASRQLGQCNVTLVRAELHVVEAPRRFHFYSTPLSRELLRRLPVAKPAVFFVDETLNRPAFDAEAIGRANAATRPELADTVWVAHGARDLPLALAHELVHVLSDSGEHSDEPGNLMREETSPQNTRLTEAQCERLRSRGATHGLLTVSAPR
jgi:hypothetical protein